MTAPAWSAHVLSLYESGKYSDFSIACKDRVFKVHKAIVCPQSPVLAAAINGDFQEAKTGVVKIDGFDVDAVETMINFFYGKKTGLLEEPILEADTESAEAVDGASTDTTEKECNVKQSEDSIRTKLLGTRLLGLIQINAIADYYDVATLRAHTNGKIRQILDDGNWTMDILLDAANATASSTGDVVLHHTFAEFAAQNMEEVYAARCEPNFEALISLKGFAVTFMEHSSVEIGSLRRSLTERIADLKKTMEALAKVLETIKEEREETNDLRGALEESKAALSAALEFQLGYEKLLALKIHERYDAVVPEIERIRDALGQWGTMYGCDITKVQQRLNNVVRDLKEAKYVKNN